MTLAVHPKNVGIIYVGTASGGLWKTTNGGATWTPLMDREGSYSIGWVTLDPKNPNVVWVGTGERNSQRSVAYGDGVYKSEDGGRSWKNVGLKNSEHIGRIVIHPENSNIVYVAAQGPLWSPGGDRGLYKTTDGGKTWDQVLKISDNTGVSDVVLDPRNPDVIVATAYQRRRHFFTLINGGPESAIHRSTDGGKTWTKVNTGLPNEELGRIGVAISAVNPDVLYAIVESANRRGGIFRSTDNGVTWERRMDYNQGSPMYYGDIFPDPVDVDRVYVPDVIFQVSDDGGRSLRALGQRAMHVDNHIIWVDPNNTQHMLVGNDGGLYRSFDGGGTWVFFENLPLAQYYDVDVDNATPFYNVYGGLQDNYSLGMPSRTRSDHGILNQDVFVTNGGDGFVTRVDPQDPNIIYAELQHGVIVRYDKRTGERVGIQPQEEKGGTPIRWNWDAPFIISPHSNTRLYMGSQFVYRSDDRGNTWRKISPDLTRQIDRNSLPVMGKIWGPDAVAKNTSTAIYSNISALWESPRREGLLWVGTDDGLIQVSEDGGANWRRTAPPGAPENAYVTRIRPSLHDPNAAYVTFSNHQNGDFKPYAFKTTDLGRSWTSISGDLPARGGTFAIAEDHVDPNLLFIGTEFAAYVSKNGGRNWLKIAGVPTIKVAEIAIQRRENDLVLGTFGRGIYIVDDYTPLRSTTTQSVANAATLYQPRDAILFVPTQHYGGRGKAFQGEMLYGGDNPPYGAVLTYYLKEGLQTLKQKRVEAEKAAEKAGQPIKYPTPAELRAEAAEEAPAILLTIADSAGKAIRVLNGPTGKGMQRVAWDLRVPAHTLPAARPASELEEIFDQGPAGPYVIPGKYSATLSQRVGGKVTQLAGPVSFNVVSDPQGTATLADHSARWQFQERLQDLRRRLAGALELANTSNTKLDAMKRALDATPTAPRALHDQTRDVQKKLAEILVELRGDQALGSRSVPTPSSISERANGISGEQNRSLGRPTMTHQEQFAIASELFAAELTKLHQVVTQDIPALERELEKAGAPWTPGRVVGQ